jgi:hypothetical protein
VDSLIREVEQIRQEMQQLKFEVRSQIGELKGLGVHSNHEHQKKQMHHIWVIGGESEHNELEPEIGAQSIVEIYEVETNTWWPGPALQTPRSVLATVNVGDYVYAIGGYSGEESLNSAERVSISSYYSDSKGVKLESKWQQIQQMQAKRYQPAAAAFEDKIYVFGGSQTNSVEIYDIKSNSWSFGPPMSLKNEEATAVRCGDLIYLIGGHTMSHPDGPYLDRMECFNTKTKEFKKLSSMHSPRGLAGAICIENLIFVFGGFSHGAPLESSGTVVMLHW